MPPGLKVEDNGRTEGGDLVYVNFPGKDFKPQTALRSVQVSSVTQLCPNTCDPMDCSKSGFLVYHQVLELAQTHIHWVSDAIQPSHPLSSPSPPAFNLVQHQGLFHQVRYWSFSFSISPSNEYSGLIFFRIHRLELFSVQGTLKSLLQRYSSKASILQCSAFFTSISQITLNKIHTEAKISSTCDLPWL